jgi:putative ABC transport system substrate-binding protein
MFTWREWVDAGGLLSDRPSYVEIARRAVDYVDQLARGAAPAELPIKQPTKFELVVNLGSPRRSALPSLQRSSPVPTK